MTNQKLQGKKILMVIARKDFRDEEYFIPKKIFEDNGAETKTASSKTGAILGFLGGETEADINIKDIKAENFDAVVFVGGNGAQEYFDDEEAHRVIKEFHDAGKTIGAICIAPVILAKTSVLKNKKATVWQSPTDKTGPKILEQAGCSVSTSNIEKSDNIITANGREASEEFAKTIMEELARR
ncbi:MAG: DJ-1/PfpI family protein [Candidatus Pacebacteria bacterium]|nr:DJ-1/PfpI family protein [Candidatus Paceibacterota bacterium]